MMERTLGPNIAWEACEPAEIRELLAELRARAPQSFAAAAVLRAQRARLPFYTDHELVDLLLQGVPGVERALLLYSQAHTQWLDGQSTPIHAVNALESPELVEATVPDYVRFFVFAMRGDQGAFVLVEQPDELTIAATGAKTDQGDDPAVQLATARAQWTPLRLDGRTDDGRFRVHATVAYAGGLYASVFAVKPDGEIEMIDDQPLGSLDGLSAPVALDLKREPEDPVPSVPPTRSIVE
jgi:hypothetical protein